MILTPGDVTGDGNADVLGRETGGRLWLYPGNGASSFLPKREIGQGWSTMTVITKRGQHQRCRPAGPAGTRHHGGPVAVPLSDNSVFGPRTKIGTGWNGYTILGPGDVSGDRRPTLWLATAPGRCGSTEATAPAWSVGEPGLKRVGGDDRTGHPGNWDLAASNDLLARDAVGALSLFRATTPAARVCHARSVRAGRA